MKKILLFFSLILSFVGVSQEFEIEEQRFPYHDIIEWKGMGAILMSKDPGTTTRKIQLTLVGNQTSSIWDEYFTPRNENFYFISSENARYVYFLDNLELENGKVYLTQLNSAGNKKTSSVSLVSAIKKVGITNFNDLELINVVVTDKALVHHFRYKDKKNKAVKEIATFITHHNFLSYSVELGSIKDTDLKNEDIGQWDYIGFTGDKICFAARDLQAKKKGWTVKEYTSKGKPTLTHFIDAPTDFIALENIGFGTTGKYYLEDKNTMDKGMLTFINNNFYMVGGERSNNSARLILYHLDGGEWKELNDMKLNYFLEKKPLKLGLYPMNEGIGYHLDHNGYNKASIITFKKQETSAHNSFTDRTIYNPSSVFSTKEKKEFSVTLPEVVLTFDTNQLGKKGPVKFVMTK
jgi:hypothetical protein